MSDLRIEQVDSDASFLDWQHVHNLIIPTASNVDGLRFAEARGFVQLETYLLPGDTIPFVTLRLP